MRDTGRATTRRRDRRYKRKLKKLSETGKRSINIFLIDRDYHYKKINKSYYKKYYIGNRKRAYKKIANRSVRRYKHRIPKGCSYKKVFDLQWEID